MISPRPGLLETSVGGDQRDFPSTQWTAILDARHRECRAQRLNELFQRYWKPIYSYIRTAWGEPNEDAKDLTQQFLVHLLEGDMLAGVDPQHGGFRTFVKVCLKNFLRDRRRIERAQKRGGGAPRLSVHDLDAIDEPAAPRDVAGPEEALDRQWAYALLEGARRELEQVLSRAGAGTCWRLFQAYESCVVPDERRSYTRLAEDFGLPMQEVKSGLDRARRELRRLVLDRIREYCGAPQQVYQEFVELFT